MEEKKIYDVVVVGAGPAGMTAALFSVRDGLKTLLISKNLGGTVNSITEIENWPGYKGTGIMLMKSFYEHLKSYPLEVILEDVMDIEKKEKEFVVKTMNKIFETKTIILSTGISRESKILGEEKFKGKGVSYCTSCDAFFFKNKITAIILKEDSKIDEIVTLSNLSQKVYAICDKKYKHEKDIKNEKVEFINNAIAKEIKGNEKVSSLIIEDKGGEKEINIDGIFIEGKISPLTDFAKKLKLKVDKNNFLVVDENMATSVKGIFAAGDVTNYDTKGVLIASAHGQIAVKSAAHSIAE